MTNPFSPANGLIQRFRNADSRNEGRGRVSGGEQVAHKVAWERSSDGFSLIEVVAALSIFAIVAAALLGAIMAGVRTAGQAKDRTIAKQLARDQLEEMRKLPWYLQHAPGTECNPGVKADVLDTFFPNASDSNYDPATGTYTKVIDSPPGGAGYQVKVHSRFVDQDLNPVVPDSTYNCTNPVTDDPPSSLLSSEVEVTWGKAHPRTLTLKSFVGNAELNEISGTGDVASTLLKVDSAFSDASTLLAEVGLGTSSIVLNNLTQARSDYVAARTRITLSTGEVFELTGASASAQAPPDSGPIDDDVPLGTLVHPLLGGLGTIFGLGPSKADDIWAEAGPGNAEAGGSVTLRHTGLLSDSGGPPGLTATNEVLSTASRPIDVIKPFVSLVKVQGLRPGKVESDCAETSSSISCQASGSLGELRIAPVPFIPLGSTDGYLVTVRLTDMQVSTVATHSGSGGSATASFVGQLSYWELLSGTYTKKTVSINSGTPTVLPNPSSVCVMTLIPLGPCTLHLSDYISSWDVATSGSATLAPDHRAAEAKIEGVLRITTEPTNPLLENSGFILRAGFMSARAIDLR